MLIFTMLRLAYLLKSSCAFGDIFRASTPTALVDTSYLPMDQPIRGELTNTVVQPIRGRLTNTVVQPIRYELTNTVVQPIIG